MGEGRRTVVRSERLKQRFLERFAEHRLISLACREAGIGSRTSVYRWQEMDAAFAAAFREAEHQAIEVLEAEAFRRAVRGTPWTRKSYWHGEPVGEETRVEYSDPLLLALLRAGEVPR